MYPFHQAGSSTNHKLLSRLDVHVIFVWVLTVNDIASFLPVYLDKKILKVDPFQVLDQNGVGKLVKYAVEKGRGVRPNLRTGICGEHGGEPSSVKFCAKIGLNYASCSPFRVPIARLAAAQAAVEE